MTEYMQYLGFWTPGPLELVIILIIAVLLFGRRLPEIARGLGKSLTEFKKGVHEVEETKDDLVSEVTKVKDDVVEEVKGAAGLDESETMS
ncbi:MAG: twin-arginine translocase TatA/TatE family subunit [Planctomycetota bacterium]